MGDVPTLKWPKKGDGAFALQVLPAGSSAQVAFVFPSPGAYTLGFKSAADMVIEAALHDCSNPDHLFFPVAYMYRHYLELTLKSIVRMGVESGVIAVPNDFFREHNLDKLWHRARKLIEAVWPDAPQADTETVEKVILEFHRLDEDGQAFRYATNTKGYQHLANAPQCISLSRLKSTMEAVANYLDATEAGLDYGT